MGLPFRVIDVPDVMGAEHSLGHANKKASLSIAIRDTFPRLKLGSLAGATTKTPGKWVAWFEAG
jgi:hypothetical protein